jgi:CRP-like cAMP-binding protein
LLERETWNKNDVIAAASLILGARSEARVATNQPVEVYSSGFAGPLPAELRDLSRGGACVALRAWIAADSVRRVTLRLPCGRLDLEAAGCWQVASEAEGSVLAGISFKNTSKAHDRVLSDFVFSTVREQAEFVGGCGAFSDLATDDLFNMAQASRYRVVPRGATVYRQGQSDVRDRSLFLIRDGGVSLIHRVGDVRNVVLMRLGPRSLFGGGGIPLISEMPNAESAVASSRTVLLEITASSFAYLRVARPLIGCRVVTAVAQAYAERMASLLERVGSAL